MGNKRQLSQYYRINLHVIPLTQCLEMSAVEFQDADSIGFRAWWETRVHPPVDMGGAMATVYVAAASGDTYGIARVYLDWDQSYGLARDYDGMAPRAR
jgi:hypothetical protein